MNELVKYGERNEVKELGMRLQTMMAGAQNLNQNEALAVAQIALAHELDPFNGEVWGIKGNNGKWYGVMVGVKGLRKCARRQAKENNDSYTVELVRVDPDKYDEPETSRVYECHLRKWNELDRYQKLLLSFMDKDVSIAEAKGLVGPPPATIGVGIGTKGERSKMTINARARKRAEADAIKQAYDVDFGEARIDVQNVDAEGPIVEINGEPVEVRTSENEGKTEDEVLNELGFGPEPEVDGKEVIDPAWNMDREAEEEPAKTETAESSDAIPVSWVDAVIKAGLAQNEFAVRGALVKCEPRPKNTEAAVAWMRLYRAWRDVGVDSDPSAKKANAGETP